MVTNNIDEICLRIHNDIDLMLLSFAKDKDISSIDLLKTEVEEYLKSLKKDGYIYKVPIVIVELENRNIQLRFYDPETGKKIEAIDQLVSQFVGAEAIKGVK